jgi:NitT/TauT family transport system substrate-binding protein
VTVIVSRSRNRRSFVAIASVALLIIWASVVARAQIAVFADGTTGVRQSGAVAKLVNAAACKAAMRGFESLPHLHFDYSVGHVALPAAAQERVRLAYFPNLTHAAGLVGVERGTFQQALGSNVTLDVKAFNAGPALIEALMAGEIDLAYVGPNPAINGYVRSRGQVLRVIAGASSGGALFVVRPAAAINRPDDLRGKKIATPQLGGTQDVALRHYLREHNLQTTDRGGLVTVIPAAPADILTLFRQGHIDGAWVPEPWATRLVLEGQGRILFDERDRWPQRQFVSTVVIASSKFLAARPDLVTAFLDAHVDTIQFIRSQPSDARRLVNAAIARITTKGLPDPVMTEAFSRLEFTYAPLSDTLAVQARHAFELGFLGRQAPDLRALYDLTSLNQVLARKRLPNTYMAEPHALELLDVGKTFHTGGHDVAALANISLTVKRGEFVCLLGASGCGKSTLLSLMAGLDRPSSGTIRANGQVVTGPSPDRALLFQEAAMFPWLNVEDNVAFGLRAARMASDERNALVRDWLTRVRLSDFAKAFTHQLSGGMKQRVALARSLAMRPSMLLMDEPFGALDALTRDRLHHELELLWGATGTTVVFVTHNVREAVALGDRVLVSAPRPGRIVGEYQVDLPRPRALDDRAVVAQAADLIAALRASLSVEEGCRWYCVV